jgi:hypothetical protein
MVAAATILRLLLVFELIIFEEAVGIFSALRGIDVVVNHLRLKNVVWVCKMKEKDFRGDIRLIVKPTCYAS